MTRRPTRHGRRGYVLLVTLGLLVLSTTLLVAVARTAVRHAADARLELQKSQRRWAIESGRRAVLPYAEQILSTVEQTEFRPAPAVNADVTLGGFRVTFVVADEQAKANVNTLLEQRKPDDVEEHLRRELSRTPALSHVRLRPGPPELTRGPPSPDCEPRLSPVSGLGQIFDDVSADVLLPARGPSPVDALTLWGDGRLNLMRAGETAARTALRPALTTLQIDRVLEARDNAFRGKVDQPPARSTGASPTRSDAVGLLLWGGGVDEGVRAKIAVTSSSTCHSLLTAVNDGRRIWYDMNVLDESNPQRPRSFNVASW